MGERATSVEQAEIDGSDTCSSDTTISTDTPGMIENAIPLYCIQQVLSSDSSMTISIFRGRTRGSKGGIVQEE